VLRTALVFGLTDELFVLLLCTASCLTERVTVELRVAPDFVLTEEPELLLTVADFLSALLRVLTAVLFLPVAEDLTAERVPTLFWVLVRALLTVEVPAALALLLEALLTFEEFLSELLLAYSFSPSLLKSGRE
jgi:hypothetical protein